MKSVFSTILSFLVLCGCSQKHTAVVDQSVDIVGGKDIIVRDYVVSIDKRDGSSIKGVRIVHRESGGNETTITADTGTLTQGAKESVEARRTDSKTQDSLRAIVMHNSVTMTLSNAFVQTKTQNGTTKVMVEKLELSF
jgi:hypothetical protein